MTYGGYQLEASVRDTLKKKRYRKAKSSTNRENLSSAYKNANNSLKKVCDQAKWDYLDKLADNLHTNDDKKLFWNYVSTKRKGTNEFNFFKRKWR